MTECEGERGQFVYMQRLQLVCEQMFQEASDESDSDA